MIPGHDIQLSFIHRCIDRYIQEVVHAMDRGVVAKKVIDTSALKNSIKGSTSGNTAKLAFMEYGRYVDMGVSKGHPLGGIKTLKQNLATLKNKSLKPRKIYSPVVYGKLNGLIGDLMYGLTEETIAEIKNELLAHASHTTT